MSEIKRYDTTFMTYNGTEDGDYVLYTDHIAALEAVKATVKPLEWSDGYAFLAPVSSGLYHVSFMAGRRVWSVRGTGMPDGFNADASSEDEAKAAAQADYEQRILSAIVPSPALEANQQVIETLRAENAKLQITNLEKRLDWVDPALEVVVSAYLEARGAVLVPRAALAEIAKVIPEITWTDATLSDTPKGETAAKTNDEARLSDVEKVVSALLADPYPRSFIAGTVLTEDEAKRLNQATTLAKEYIWNMGGAVA